VPLVIVDEIAHRIIQLDDAVPSSVRGYCHTVLRRIQDAVAELGYSETPFGRSCSTVMNLGPRPFPRKSSRSLNGARDQNAAGVSPRLTEVEWRRNAVRPWLKQSLATAGRS
jgi:hypothetical protein